MELINHKFDESHWKDFALISKWLLISYLIISYQIQYLKEYIGTQNVYETIETILVNIILYLYISLSYQPQLIAIFYHVINNKLWLEAYDNRILGHKICSVSKTQ